MKISKRGIAFIQKEEGTILHVYKDQVGLATVGTGHRTDMPVGTKITQAIADSLLAKDLERFENTINAAVKAQLTQNQFDALCSFTFNVGSGALLKSSLLTAINAGHAHDAELITKCFCLWRNAESKPILLARRQREAALFLS